MDSYTTVHLPGPSSSLTISAAYHISSSVHWASTLSPTFQLISLQTLVFCLKEPAQMSDYSESLESILAEHLPAEKLAEVNRILYGKDFTSLLPLLSSPRRKKALPWSSWIWATPPAR